jgi:hypothetical protein
VVRRRSSHAVRTLAEATEDMRTTAAIEAQYVMDPRLSALTIEVDTHSGVVTLAGRVDTAADVAHAIELAMRHRNVREVISDAAGRAAGRGRAAALAHAVAFLTQSASSARPNGTPLAPGIPGDADRATGRRAFIVTKRTRPGGTHA